MVSTRFKVLALLVLIVIGFSLMFMGKEQPYNSQDLDTPPFKQLNKGRDASCISSEQGCVTTPAFENWNTGFEVSSDLKTTMNQVLKEIRKAQYKPVNCTPLDIRRTAWSLVSIGYGKNRAESLCLFLSEDITLQKTKVTVLRISKDEALSYICS